MFQRIRYDNILGFGAQISFYLLVSLIPFLVLMLTLLSNLHIVSANFIASTLRNFEIIPDAVFNLIESSIIGVTMPSSSVPFYILVVLWFASRGIRSIMNVIHMTFRTQESKNLIKHFLSSFFLTIAFIILLILFMVFILFGDALSQYLSEKLSWSFLIETTVKILRYFIPLFFLFIFYTALYCVIPAKELKIRDVLPGSLFATVCSFGVSKIFSVMTTSATSYSALYGGISGVIITCTWMYFFSIVLVLGSEVNACLYEIKNNTTLISIH